MFHGQVLNCQFHVWTPDFMTRNELLAVMKKPPLPKPQLTTVKLIVEWIDKKTPAIGVRALESAIFKLEPISGCNHSTITVTIPEGCAMSLHHGTKVTLSADRFCMCGSEKLCFDPYLPHACGDFSRCYYHNIVGEIVK